MSDQSSDGWARIEQAFQHALKLDHQERDSYLTELREEAPKLYDELQKLLAAHDHAEEFLETPAIVEVDTPSGPSHAPVQIGTRVGAYVIQRLIASGGMGTVYEASQQHPERRVALKVMNQHLGTRSAERRFEFEVQVLGRLKHPGIAQIIEAGVAKMDGQSVPFFAMELVQGKTLTDYLDVKQPGDPARLKLLISICEAVHHAHQRGVIHRDLKPDNILVDQSGLPKILDFGIARATDVDIRRPTMRTDVGEVLGTLAYMSPEQVAGDPAAIDIRSDVYALGVIAYELIAGSPPYVLTNKSLPEALRIIREEEPEASIMAGRSIRGDLRTIIAKALEKEKEQRYASASEFAADIRRFLNDEPIVARPPSTFYQFRKFAKRNRTLVGATAAVVVALLGGVVTTSIQAGRARLAEAAAKREAGTAKAVTEFLTQTLVAADPFHQQDADVSIRDAIDAASGTVETNLRGQPLVEAAVREVIGTIYRHLAVYDRAREHLAVAEKINREHLGDDHPATLSTRMQQAVLAKETGRYDESQELFEHVLVRRRILLGTEHEDTIGAMINLADLHHERGEYVEAVTLARETLDILRRTHLEMNEITLTCMNHLALYLHKQGELREAEDMMRRTLAGRRQSIGSIHPSTLITIDNLATLLRELGQLAEAERLHREALAGFEKTLGEDHFETLRASSNLGGVLVKLEKYDEAEDVYRRTLAARQRVLGEDHLDMMNSYYGLANFLAERGKLREAERLMRKARAGVQRILGEDNRYYVFTTHGLANVLEEKGEHGAAEALHREALRTAEAVFPADHPRVSKMRTAYGRCLTMLERFEQAESELLAAYASAKRALGGEHETTVTARRRIVELYEAWGKPDKAMEYSHSDHGVPVDAVESAP